MKQSVAGIGTESERERGMMMMMTMRFRAKGAASKELNFETGLTDKR
jgi:hypothetical protein